MMSTKWKRSVPAMRTGLTDREEWENGDGRDGLDAAGAGGR